MLSEDFIARVRDNTDLLALASKYTEMKRAGGNVWAGRCPHPDHDDRTPSFRVWHNPNGTWTWGCYGCHSGKKDLAASVPNYGSDCFAFLQWMSDFKESRHIVSFPEAVRFLAQKANIPMEKDKFSDTYRILERVAESWRYGLSEEQRGYLYRRGLSDSDIDAWKIGGAYFGKGKSLGYRISFPLMGRYEQIYGFCARLHDWTSESSLPKYWNSQTSDHFRKSSYLYGLQHISSESGEIRITEGAFDVILAHKYGALNVVGTLGTAFTDDHAKLVQTMNKTPVFCMDGDEAGRKGVERSIRLLSRLGIHAKVCILPKGMDLADLAVQEKDNLEKWISDHTMLHWQFLMKKEAEKFEAKVNELRMAVLPSIREAIEGTLTKDEKTMAASFVFSKFGIALDPLALQAEKP